MRISNIQPITVWSDGQFVNIVKLGIKISNDDMVQEAAFQYSLLTADNVSTNTGFLNIDGEDYQNWGSTGNANEEAVVWVANKLNLILQSN